MKQPLISTFFSLLTLFLLHSCSDENTASLEDNTVEKTIVSANTRLMLFIENDTVPSTRTSSAMEVDGTSILISQGDSALCYDITTGTCASIFYDSNQAAFIGNIYLNPLDEISVVYPYPQNAVISNNLSLTYSLDHSYCWGFTDIKIVEDTTTATIKLFDLMARCKVTVVDEANNIINTSSITLSPSKGRLYNSRALNLRTGTFENGTFSEDIELTSANQNEDGSYEWFLFPTSALLSATFTDSEGRVFEGVTKQVIFREGEQNNLTIICSTAASAKEFVEVCGIKWAKGNLLFAADEDGAEGFQPHWRLGTTQYEYFNPVYGTKGTALSVDLPYDTIHVHLFNWGTCGKNSLDIAECGKGKNTDISARLFKDKYFKYETTDFDEALYGDVSYWASKGKWRMPTIDELYTLYNEASYSYGYATTPDGNLVYGFFFTTPYGERVVDTNVHYYTPEDLDRGLFLPGAGFRQQASPIIKRTGKCGFFWDSYRGETAQQMCMRFIGTTLYWSDDGATYGRTIRPVLND